jgi:hypothetical protein
VSTPSRDLPEPDASGAVLTACLPLQHCLHVGDIIVSANAMFYARLEHDGRLCVYCGAGQHETPLWESGRSGDGGRFFALVQSDGNFCIYRGDDLDHNEGWHWGTQFIAEGGQFHLVLQDDGELLVRAGADDSGDIIWCSGVSDPVATIDSISAIDYQLDAAQTLQARPSDLYRETVSNTNGQIQTSMISGSVTVSDTTGWSDELAHDAAAPQDYRGPVPVVHAGKVVLSCDAGHTYIRNGAATTAKSWGFSAPAAVPPHSSMTCLVSATRSSIRVPYRLHGRFTLASGRQVDGSVRGVYGGANCHDLSVTLTTFDPTPAGSYSISQPLTPMPNHVGSATPHPLAPDNSL